MKGYSRLEIEGSCVKKKVNKMKVYNVEVGDSCTPLGRLGGWLLFIEGDFSWDY